MIDNASEFLTIASLTLSYGGQRKRYIPSKINFLDIGVSNGMGKSLGR